MKKKKSLGASLESFFEGKGFYIVLFLCAGVISVSAWVLMTGTNVNEPIGDVGYIGATVTPEIIKITPAPEDSTTIEIEPVPTPVVLPEVETVPEAAIEVFTETTQLFVWPVAGETITEYSVDALVFNETMQDWRTHDAIDIAAAIGTQVMAVSNGEVISIENDVLYGTTVVIKHANDVESIYSNLATQPTVSVGDSVSVGQVIGSVGDTAMCESSLENHLHFALKEAGKSIDPQIYLP